MVVLSKNEYKVKYDTDNRGSECVWLIKEWKVDQGEGDYFMESSWYWMALASDHRYLRDLEGKEIRVIIEVIAE